MTALFVSLMVGTATPLAPDAWSVGPDGLSCVQLEEALAKELGGWQVDPEKSVAGEGVWARVNPTNPRQMVLIFKSERICREFLQALHEDPGPPEKPTPLGAERVSQELKAFVATDTSAREDWAKLGVKERQSLIQEAQKLFGPGLEKAGVTATIGALHKIQLKAREAGQEMNGASRVRLGIWLHLFKITFGVELELPPARQ
jgi:hypothetical protein